MKSNRLAPPVSESHSMKQCLILSVLESSLQKSVLFVVVVVVVVVEVVVIVMVVEVATKIRKGNIRPECIIIIITVVITAYYYYYCRLHKQRKRVVL